MSLFPSIPHSEEPENDGAAEVNVAPESQVNVSTPNLAPPSKRHPHSRCLTNANETVALTAEQRLLLLDTWRRSGLPAGDFAPLVGISKHTLYAWKHKFELEGPAGLEDKPRGGPTGSRLPEVTKRTILMLKQDNPDWGCERISSMLLRGPATCQCQGRSPSSADAP